MTPSDLKYWTIYDLVSALFFIVISTFKTVISKQGRKKTPGSFKLSRLSYFLTRHLTQYLLGSTTLLLPPSFHMRHSTEPRDKGKRNLVIVLFPDLMNLICHGGNSLFLVNTCRAHLAAIQFYQSIFSYLWVESCLLSFFIHTFQAIDANICEE